MQVTAGEAIMNSFVTFFYWLLRIDVPLLANQEKFISIISMLTLGVLWMTCQERWRIMTDGEWDSWKSVQSVRIDDDDNDDIY